MRYTYESLYKYLKPLFKHSVDVFRATEVTDSEHITREVLEQVYSNVEAYCNQYVRAPFDTPSNQDTLRMSGMYNLHVPTSCHLRNGDFVNIYLIDGTGNKTFIGRGYCGDIRFGTAFNRCHINLDDTREQNPTPITF